jgi:hypothetical protein
MNLIVRFGEEYNDDNELLIPFLWWVWENISQYIHEMIVLSVPKTVHPGVKDGSLKTEGLIN